MTRSGSILSRGQPDACNAVDGNRFECGILRGFSVTLRLGGATHMIETMETDSRLVLLDQVRQGNQVALGSLLEELRPYVRVIVRSMRRGRLTENDESDFIQDALMQASLCAGTFQGATLGELLGWLRAITVRTTHRTMNSAHPESASRPAHYDLATQIVDPAAGPTTDAIRQETAARMAVALTRLPEDMQQVLVGRFVDGLDHGEMATQLGRSSGAVRMLYLRALRRLREVWQSEFSSAAGISQ